MIYWKRYINDRANSPLGDCPYPAAGERGRETRVLRVELPRFREQVKSLWQALLCYFVLSRDKGQQPPPPVVQQQQQAVAAAGVASETSHIKETSHIREEVREEFLDIPMILVIWWIPALLFYGLGDTLTTALVYSVGGREANPMARWLIAYSGSITLFALVKTVIIIALLFISFYWLGKLGWIVPAILTAIGVYLVVNNIMVYMAYM